MSAFAHFADSSRISPEVREVPQAAVSRCSKHRLFDHLLGSGLQRESDCKAERGATFSAASQLFDLKHSSANMLVDRRRFGHQINTDGVLYQTAETLTHLCQRLRLSAVPISHWTTVRFWHWMSRWNSRRMSQGLRVLVLDTHRSKKCRKRLLFRVIYFYQTFKTTSLENIPYGPFGVANLELTTFSL